MSALCKWKVTGDSHVESVEKHLDPSQGKSPWWSLNADVHVYCNILVEVVEVCDSTFRVLCIVFTCLDPNIQPRYMYGLVSVSMEGLESVCLKAY